MISILLLISIITRSDHCITSCNTDLDQEVCYYDPDSCNVRSIRCEDLVNVSCKPLKVNLGKWDPELLQ